jgi:hypothetical protein
MSTLDHWTNKLTTMRERIFGKNGLPLAPQKSTPASTPPPSNEQPPMVKKSAEDDAKVRKK